ncbi:MAG: zinc ribbon domain-containing protein [Verrucomicrobiota bacterium]|nr:zinc ribbon domain-containing protein [Verrucomicrobiota bacterium]
MPTYEYECARCGNRFERFQGITELPVKRCPRCRSKVRRLPGTGAGVIFKGSGFYQTDYRSSNYREAAKKEKALPDAATAKEAKKDDASGKAKESGKKPTNREQVKQC